MSLSKIFNANVISHDSRKKIVTNKNKLILLSGPSCCGKTTLCKQFEEHFNKNGKKQIVVLSMDRYYKNLDPSSNYDDPSAIEFDLLVDDVIKLINNLQISAPIYNFESHSRDPQNTTIIDPAKIIILEGTLVHCDKRLDDLASRTMMIKCEDWILVDRRHVRDVKERGRTPESISEQLKKTVMPSKRKYIDPYMIRAEVVLDNNEDQHFQNSEAALPYIQKLIDDDNDNDNDIDDDNRGIKRMSPEAYLKYANEEEIELLKKLLLSNDI